MSFATTYIAVLLSSTAAVVLVQGSFQVLRGGNQPTHEEMKIVNTPRLMQYAAFSGEQVTITLVEGEQTAVVQHHVNVIMDCSSLIQPGGKLLNKVKWTRQSYFADEDDILVPKGTEVTIYESSRGRLRATGTLGHILNITTTNIIQGAERDDNGMYSCTICKGTGCKSARLMLFLIGAPPRMNFVDDNTQAEESSLSFADKKYRIGADFCVERGSDEIIELSCDVFGENLEEHISISYPTPSRKWYKDGVLLYSVDKLGESVYRGRNRNFFNGQNGILTYGVVEPSPLYTSREGQIVLAFEASELAYPEFAPEGTTNQTVVDDVFNALSGTWRCEVGNILGRWMAETVISEC